MTVKRFKGADVFLDEPSVTATENALIAAASAEGDHDPPQLRQRAARAGPGRFPHNSSAQASRASARTR
jgi:hypothetical protein